MKHIVVFISLLFLATAATAVAQDPTTESEGTAVVTDVPNDHGDLHVEDADAQQGAGSLTRSEPESFQPEAVRTKPPELGFLTREEYARYVLAQGKCKKSFNRSNPHRAKIKPTRKAAIPKKGEGERMPNVNVTVNVPPIPPQKAAAEVQKNPNMDGVFKIDPNLFPQGNGNLTLSLGADGSAYMNRSGGNLEVSAWFWYLLGFAAVLALWAIAARRGDDREVIVREVRQAPGGSGNGGVVINNHPTTTPTHPAAGQTTVVNNYYAQAVAPPAGKEPANANPAPV